MFGRELGREAVEARIFDRAQFTLQRPLLTLRGMPNQRPKVRDMAQGWLLIHDGFLNRDLNSHVDYDYETEQ